MEDLDLANIQDSINAVYLNSALFGTGIIKVTVEDIGGGEIRVHADPVNPNEFLIDPTALNVDEAFGVVHEMHRPLHGVQLKQDDGTYNKGMIAQTHSKQELKDGSHRRDYEANQQAKDNEVLITEYHGLVPLKLLDKKDSKEDAAEGLRVDDEPGFLNEAGEELVEAIVTIANENFVLKAERNPYLLQDRGFIAYQHELVPGRFWGRGVAEKGYNPQKAFDAEHRMRMDAMAYRAAPMFMYNIAALGGKKFRLNPRPGRQIPVAGAFALDTEVVRPVDMGQTDPGTFSQTQELEKMINVGTGAMDISGFAAQAANAETATGASVGKSVFVKRAKLVQKNIERNFLMPLVKKTLMRYIQFDKRYPKKDVKFIIDGALGMVAREMEQQSLVQMIGLVEQGSGTQRELVRSFVESSSHPNRAGIIQALEEDGQPDPEEEKQKKIQEEMQQLGMEKMKLENEELKKEMEKLSAQVKQIIADAMAKIASAEQAEDKNRIETRRAGQEDRRLDQDEVRLNLDKARLTLDSRKPAK